MLLTPTNYFLFPRLKSRLYCRALCSLPLLLPSTLTPTITPLYSAPATRPCLSLWIIPHVHAPQGLCTHSFSHLECCLPQHVVFLAPGQPGLGFLLFLGDTIPDHLIVRSHHSSSHYHILCHFLIKTTTHDLFGLVFHLCTVNKETEAQRGRLLSPEHRAYMLWARICGRSG